MDVLFTGLGSIGRRHLRLLRERDETFRVLAYRSGHGNSETPDDVIEYRDLSAALDADPDVAFITNPTHLHVETAIRCARSGCDLLVEKPLADGLEGVDELCSLVEEADLVTLMGCNLRFHRPLRFVEYLLRTDAVGAVRSFRATASSYLPDWYPDRDYRSSYSARRGTGGGVVLDLIHELDYCHWLFAPVEGVFGRTGRVSDLDIETEDVAEIVLQTGSCGIGSVHLDYFSRAPKRTLEVFGSKGRIHVDLLSGDMRLRTSTSDVSTTVDSSMDDSYRRQLSYFLDCVRERAKCENDVFEGKRVLETALKAKHERINGK